MKNYLALTVFVLSGYLSYAHTDSTNGNQAPADSQGDYRPQRQPDPEEQKKDRLEISKEKLPSVMLEELDNNPRYEGWKQGNVFYERNTDQFIVHVKRNNSTQTFRFDKQGLPLQNNENLDIPDKKKLRH